MKDKDIDVGIITIIPTEIEALFKTLNIRAENIVEINSPFTYWTTEFYSYSSQRNIRSVISFINRDSGNTEAAICTSYFLHDWYPRLMCLVGIAAGLRGKTRIGDVVVPNNIHDRTIKVFKNGTFVVRGTSYSRVDVIDRMIKTHPISKDEFKLKYEQPLHDIEKAHSTVKKGGLSRNEFNGNLRILDGSLSSDNILIRDTAYFEGIINETDEKCMGGDMETAGFVRACQTADSRLPWLIFRGISDFGNSDKDESFQLLAAKSACIVLRMYLEKSIDVDRLPQNPRAKALQTSLELNLLDDVRNAYNSRRWHEVCRIGNVISRHLWLSGQYDLRIEIGKYVEEAAGFIEDNLTRARTLIDDLGWTSFIIGQELKAKKYIIDGIRLSKEINNYYLMSKGKRHLASIVRRDNKLDEATKLLNEARQYADNISDDDEKSEILNTLLVSEGKLLFAQKNIPASTSKFEEALENFKKSKDTNRESKIYAPLGKANIELRKKTEALRLFYEGRRLAFSMGRFDEISNNSLLLIDTLEENQQTEKLKIANEVYDFAKSVGLIAQAKKWKLIIEQINHGGKIKT